MKKSVSFLLVLLMLLGALCSCHVADKDSTPPVEDAIPPSQEGTLVDARLAEYDKALTLLREGKLEEAYTIFLTLRDYADTADYLDRFAFKYTQKFYNGSPDVYYEYDEYGKVTYEYHSPLSISDFFYTYEYDESQRLIKKQYGVKKEIEPDIWYEYEIRSTILNEYDTNGHLIKQTETEGDTVYTTTVEFDERGNKAKVHWGRFGVTLEYRYDEANNLLEMVVRNQSGNVTEGDFYEYDSSGRVIREEHRIGTSKREVQIYEYDEVGRTRSMVQELNGRSQSRHEFEYDQDGNCKQELITYTGGSTSMVIWRYDKNGNVIEEYKESDGKILSRDRYEYDANGNCVKKTSERPIEGRVSEEFCEYDKWGNLLKTRYVMRDGDGSNTYEIGYGGYTLYYDPYLT